MRWGGPWGAEAQPGDPMLPPAQGRGWAEVSGTCWSAEWTPTPTPSELSPEPSPLHLIYLTPAAGTGKTTCTVPRASKHLLSVPCVQMTPEAPGATEALVDTAGYLALVTRGLQGPG